MADNKYYEKEIVTITLANANEVNLAADRIKQGNAVLVNFSGIEAGDRLAAMSYLQGVVYALDGNWRDIGNKVLLFAPPNVAVTLEGTT